MKTRYFSVLSLMLMAMCCNVVFTSCGDDDDEDVVLVKEKHYYVKDLIGTWEYTPDDAPGTISSITFFDDSTALSVIRDKVANPDSPDTDKEGVINKRIEKYEFAGDSLFVLHKHLYQYSKYKDLMWHPLSGETKRGLKIKFVDDNTLKLIDSNNKQQPEITLHRNTFADVEKIEVFDKRLIGTWENIVDASCRDIIIFDADGNYHQMDRDTRKDPSTKYYDDNLTYYQTKGYCNAINGTMDMAQTYEWDHKWNAMDWRKHTATASFAYVIVDENTFSFSYTNEEIGKKETVTYTRVK